ncbi:387_t:CDS:2 [Entrophospora sp. SA101]|nr:387_t:CDS:2 [Entrophospora sp. SA101]
MDKDSIAIKVSCNTNNIETVTRKISIDKNIKLEELEYKIRERFNINYDRGIDIYYIDEENDRIYVTHEDELLLVLKSQESPKFDVVVKSVKSKSGTKAWGTYIFTDDSDIVKALAHSEKIELADTPPSHNVIATIRFLPGCLEYVGSTNQGISTLDFNEYDLSYVIEGVRTVRKSSKKIKPNYLSRICLFGSSLYT